VQLATVGSKAGDLAATLKRPSANASGGRGGEGTADMRLTAALNGLHVTVLPHNLSGRTFATLSVGPSKAELGPGTVRFVCPGVTGAAGEVQNGVPTPWLRASSQDITLSALADGEADVQVDRVCVSMGEDQWVPQPDAAHACHHERVACSPLRLRPAVVALQISRVSLARGGGAKSDHLEADVSGARIVCGGGTSAATPLELRSAALQVERAGSAVKVVGQFSPLVIRLCVEDLETALLAAAGRGAPQLTADVAALLDALTHRARKPAVPAEPWETTATLLPLTVDAAVVKSETGAVLLRLLGRTAAATARGEYSPQRGTVASLELRGHLRCSFKQAQSPPGTPEGTLFTINPLHMTGRWQVGRPADGAGAAASRLTDPLRFCRRTTENRGR
jgi:hypothetical protein